MKHLILLLILTIAISQFGFSQDTLPKYGKIQINWNNLLKQDWFEHAPNRLLMEFTRDLIPGKALDVACGEGRNSIYLAKQGWDVTAFDIANEALDSIQSRAKKLGLQINTMHASREDFDFGENRWDLVVLCYADIICKGCIANDDFIPVLAKAIKKDGLVVYEMGHRDFYLENWKEPAAWGCTEERLTKAFENEGFKVLHCDTIFEKADWSSGKKGKLLKFVAIK